MQPFSGRGYRLEGSEGGSVSTISTGESGSSQTVNPMPSEVDPNKPITSIQIRLHDGTRLVARFNEDQTLGDIRRYNNSWFVMCLLNFFRFVSSARPLPSNTNFELSLQFPRQILSEDSKTIRELGLKGSVIVQTIK